MTRRPALALVTLAFATLAAMASGQAAGQAGAAALPAFEVVSVRPFHFPGHYWDRDAHFDPQRLFIQGMAPVELIDLAYSLNRNQLVGLPPWAQFSHDSLYSITATTSQPASKAQMLLMLRRVLAERFQLVLSVSDKPQPVYDLEVAPGGPKLAVLKPGEDCDTAAEAFPHPSGKQMVDWVQLFDVCTISDLVGRLNIPNFLVDRPVIDRTGLTGKYVIVAFQRIGKVERMKTGGTRIGYWEPMADVLKRELGLMLVKATGPYRIFKVTHIARPGPDS